MIKANDIGTTKKFLFQRISKSLLTLFYHHKSKKTWWPCHIILFMIKAIFIKTKILELKKCFEKSRFIQHFFFLKKSETLLDGVYVKNSQNSLDGVYVKKSQNSLGGVYVKKSKTLLDGVFLIVWIFQFVKSQKGICEEKSVKNSLVCLMVFQKSFSWGKQSWYLCGSRFFAKSHFMEN